MFPIVKLPTQSLKDPSTEVDRDFVLQADTQEFIKELIETMYAGDGIGIASPQVGKNVRICIVGKDAVPGKEKDFVLINPVWQKTSRKKVWEVEGCLSVPKTFGKVARYVGIHVEAMNEAGKKIEFDAHKFFARVNLL
ncbi:MAG: peptide deformylase [Candidatus Magasanikbacteria bacterium]|nr:peptide deformylase [Candidatus Magasanikbacteria bacterium]